MNIKDLKASLDYLFAAEQTAFIWGHAGIGKTTVVKQYAKDKGYQFFPFYLGTQSDLGDILGLASFVKDENGSEIATTFATPVWLKNTIDFCEANPDSGAIIFLDEFNRARRDILNGMFSFALDKKFHTLQLPKNCHIIAAGNPPTEEYFVTDVDETALMARFTHIKLEPSFDEWITYAKGGSFEPTLLSFLADQPQLLEDSKTDFKLPVKVDRRAWARLDRLFKVGTPIELLEQLANGIIGIERLVAYKLHLTKVDKPLSGEQVLNGEGFEHITTWSNPSDIKASLLGGTCDNVFEWLQTPVVQQYNLGLTFLRFLEIIPRDMSYPLMKRLLKADNKAFRTFMVDPAFEPTLVAITKEAKGIK